MSALLTLAGDDRGAPAPVLALRLPSTRRRSPKTRCPELNGIAPTAQRGAWRLEREIREHKPLRTAEEERKLDFAEPVAPRDEYAISTDLDDALSIVQQLPPRLQRIAMLRALGLRYSEFCEGRAGHLVVSAVRIRLFGTAGRAGRQAARSALYRIVQEGLTNTLKHAHASRVDVAIRHTENAVEIALADNGRHSGSVPARAPCGLPR